MTDATDILKAILKEKRKEGSAISPLTFRYDEANDSRQAEATADHEGRTIVVSVERNEDLHIEISEQFPHRTDTVYERKVGQPTADVVRTKAQFAGVEIAKMIC